MHKNDAEAVAVVAAAPDTTRKVHPTLLDAAFQLLGIVMGLHVEACVPTHMEQFVLTDAKKGVPSTGKLKVLPPFLSPPSTQAMIIKIACIT